MEKSAVDVVTFIAYHLTKAVTAFIQRDSFLYWPYLLSAAAIALAIFVIVREPRWSPRETVSRWWHPSARADYRLYFANALVVPALFAIAMFGDTHVADLLGRAFGAAPREPAVEPSIAARIAFTIVFFVAYDFGRFVAHSLLHDVPFLWEFHKVHHSAETLNPMTSFRAHPIDLLVMSWVPIVMTGLVTWAFNQLTVAPLSVYSYLGLHVLLFTSNLVGTLRHTHVWLSYGPAVGKWLVSPAQHQLHHSYEPLHMGCNRGFELAVWDRLYGTLYVPRERETFRMGLGDGTEAQWHNVRRMYWRPFVNAGRSLAGSLRRQPPAQGPVQTSGPPRTPG